MPDVDLNRVQIFKEVVLAGSFSKAALALKQPKSRVSRNITALERELGVQLIHRTTRQFQLTDAGREFYRKAAAPLEQIRDALDQISSFSEEVFGALRVSVPEDVGVALMGAICREFILAHPKVTLELHVANRIVDLVNESVDVALRIGRLKDSSMLQKKVGMVRSVIVMSPDLRDRIHVLRAPVDLDAVPFLSFSSFESPRSTYKLTNGREVRSLKPTPFFASNNHFVLRDLAIQGAGYTILPEFVAAEALSRGQLVRVLKGWKSEDVPVQLVMPQQREILPRVRRFTEFAATRLAQAFS